MSVRCSFPLGLLLGNRYCKVGRSRPLGAVCRLGQELALGWSSAPNLLGHCLSLFWCCTAPINYTVQCMRYTRQVSICELLVRWLALSGLETQYAMRQHNTLNSEPGLVLGRSCCPGAPRRRQQPSPSSSVAHVWTICGNWLPPRIMPFNDYGLVAVRLRKRGTSPWRVQCIYARLVNVWIDQSSNQNTCTEGC